MFIYKYFKPIYPKKIVCKTERRLSMKKWVGMMICFCLLMVLGWGCSFSLKKTEIPCYVPNENCRQVSFKPGLEPEGFNGIKWETNISTLQGMKRFETNWRRGGIDFYKREGDGFQLRNGKSIPIQYGFWNEKFYIGMVTTEGASDWNALKEVVFSKYGEGAKPFKNKEEYLWTGGKTFMALRYDEETNEGLYYIKTESMTKEIDSSRSWKK
jgi:hypothetical protein